MEQSKVIYQKLESFIKKFYTNELIRGSIFFVGLGLLYFLFTLFIEHFLWLKPFGRTILFWIFVGVETFLLVRFILFPIFKLLKLQKGIDYKQASAIIGNHFSSVSDKLTNFLQLKNDTNQSELLLASIEQKANALQPIPFGNAVNFNSNRKYLPLAILPVLFFMLFYWSGNGSILSQSLNRVVHFKEQFLPPAPFRFVILNPNLQTQQNEDFVLSIKTAGKVIPENAKIFIGNESYFMQKTKAGEFQFKIEKPMANTNFHLEANTISSLEYELKVIQVPSITNFEMILNFPSYLNRKPERINGNGNAIIPEGTNVRWKIATQATQNVIWKQQLQQFTFKKQDQNYLFSKTIFQNTDYQILTSNEKVANYEKLNYQLSVIKDQFPTIEANPIPDSLKVARSYVLGKISDDYGFLKLQVVYYPKNDSKAAKRGLIKIKSDIFDQFVFSFPDNLPVSEGVNYEYYFEVFDNDVLHGFKSTKSAVFSSRIATNEEKQDQELQQQNDNINSLEKSLKNQDKQLSDLDKLQKMGKEKDNFEFKDQQKINEFLKRQQQQDQKMKEFAEKMKTNLDKTKTDKKDEFKEELQKRLDNVEKDLEKNKKLLDELKELNDKIKKEELMEKMDKFKQNSKNQTKNLEQLVELTKKYYVEKKTQQLKEKLEKLAKKQEELSNKEKENNLENQKDINDAFEKFLEELKELSKENEALKKPIELPSDKEKEKNINEDLKKASEELQKNSKDKAKPKQKSAAKKMKQMAQKMEENMEEGEQEQLQEDVAMLRQVLDNLLAFSFTQEDVMIKFKKLNIGSPAFNKKLKTQQDLKLQFKHIDDSLFAMSLRNPKLGEDLTKEVGNALYNIDKSLETLSDGQLSKGVSHQQYTVSSANKLADILSSILNNMKMSMSGMGKSKPSDGEEMQLPDIIKKQEKLGNKMKDGMEKGQKPKDGKEDGKEGNKPGEGKEGRKEGNKSGEGKEGGKSGEKGKDGKNGKSDQKGENSNGENSNGENGEDGEGDAKAIMEIYKEQKQLREALQNELDKKGLGGNGNNALEQMKQIEKQLLNKGFKNDVLQRVLNVKQELLKLDSAIQQQGQDNKRQSETNKKEFNNPSNALPSNVQDYLQRIEILNRQSLPLRTNFNQKVQDYFKAK